MNADDYELMINENHKLFMTLKREIDELAIRLVELEIEVSKMSGMVKDRNI